MGAAVRTFPEITAEEWDIIVELLERERAELPVEIRHTFRHAFRDQLQARLNKIDSLLDRIKARNPEMEAE